ncbi:metalloregulator ArsR/SmtB family transcription factor [uncultured Aquimonas sp.]|jgi:ArsR family transcriptional regulator, virulence genes transcriptional regulator|uniref:ArsR/SmtB family transcription factor n=1 Tax=uncultured Aquimonas sp. TaxID=385483 RepID=UPI00086A3AB3|nr:metalloregulator ArsR/SmtB family transcription factor [uncultured Aquimonas sp.]ODU44782.1 MAG: transcriptional regulator [Xanthomonadaceae bacterium SCN 69-123]
MPPLAPTDAEEMRAHAHDAARLLKAMANDRRLMILCMLVGGEQAVSDINAGMELSQSALSQHLAVLREEGLVQTRRSAQTIYYSLTPGPVQDIIGVLHRIYCGEG